MIPMPHPGRSRSPCGDAGARQRASVGIDRVTCQPATLADQRGFRRILMNGWVPPPAPPGGARMTQLVDDRRPGLDPSLESHFATLLARHKEATAKTGWGYHEFLPLAAFRAEATDRSPLSPTAYLAVETALLTEVNLPWYTAGLSRGLESCPAPIQEFVRVWTSEEDQHATLLESYLLFTGSGDFSARGRSRKAMIAAGWNQ